MRKYRASRDEIFSYFYAKEHDFVKAMGLCYFAYAWGLVFLGCEIAPFRFKKTDVGPIDKSLFDFTETRAVLDSRLSDYLYFIWTKYGRYTGDQVMARIKKQPPYKNATVNISKKSIAKFFKLFRKR